MGWPIPQLEKTSHPAKPSPWLVVAVAMGGLMIGDVLILLLWPASRGKTAGLSFWLCLIGLPIATSVGCVGIVYHFHGIRVLYCDARNLLGQAIHSAWQRWAHRHAVLSAFSTLTPEASLAERISGLAGTAPQNKSRVLRLEGFDGDYHADRTEVVLKHLLDDIKPRLNALGTDQTLQVSVWVGAEANLDSVNASATVIWESLALRPHARIEAVQRIEWSMIDRQVLTLGAPLLILCAQLHDGGGELAKFTESASALLFEPPRRQTSCRVV
jgi:hypothetical protein